MDSSVVVHVLELAIKRDLYVFMKFKLTVLGSFS